MSTIIDRSYIGGDNDKILSVTNEQIGRTFSVGSSWKRLRIGIRYEVSSSGANIVGPNFAFGLCSGTSSMYADSTTQYFIGSDMDTTQGLDYLVSTMGLYRPAGGGGGTYGRFCTKVGATTTVYANQTEWMPLINTVGSPNRAFKFIDFTKSDGDPGLWNITYTWYRVAQWYNTDVTSGSFYSNMTNDVVTLPADNTSSIYTVPISESVYGHLDTINVYWSKTYPPLEISDVAAYRFQ